MLSLKTKFIKKPIQNQVHLNYLGSMFSWTTQTLIIKLIHIAYNYKPFFSGLLTIFMIVIDSLSTKIINFLFLQRCCANCVVNHRFVTLIQNNKSSLRIYLQVFILLIGIYTIFFVAWEKCFIVQFSLPKCCI